MTCMAMVILTKNGFRAHLMSTQATNPLSDKKCENMVTIGLGVHCRDLHVFIKHYQLFTILFLTTTYKRFVVWVESPYPVKVKRPAHHNLSMRFDAAVFAYFKEALCVRLR